MATLRTVINRVCRTVSETAVGAATTELTTDYHLLLLEFINQFKEEIEDATNWRSLRTILTGTVSASGYSVALTGGTERSRLVRIHNPDSGELQPLAFDVTNSAVPVRLTEMPLAELLYKLEEDQATGPATFFAIDSSAGDVLTAYIWPRAAASTNLKFTFTVPQAVLSATDLDTNIKIPMRPLLQGATWFALQERGEELGQSSIFTEERYRTALDDAISRDSAEQGSNDQLVPV